MNETKQFNQTFSRKLSDDGYSPTLMESLFTVQSGRKPDVVKTTRKLTGYSNDVIRNGLFRPEREVTLPLIETGVRKILEPWIRTSTDEALPALQVIELARATQLSPEKVIDTLSKYPLTVAINGSRFKSSILLPDIPKRKLGLKDSAMFGISPKRIFKSALYSSRPRGGGPVQKSRLQMVKNSDGVTDGSRIDPLIRRDARKKAKVIFEPLQKYADKEIKEIKPKTAKEMIYDEPKGQQIMEVYRWFEQFGGGRQKNWITGKEDVLAEKLIELARGQEVDFLIWNCFGFAWQQDKPGEYPTATLINKLDTAITDYFSPRIQEMINQLSRIGNPQVVILVPTNEVLADESDIWKYSQTRPVREQLVNETIPGFSSITASIELQPGVNPIQVMRWDEYLIKSQANSQEFYTEAGINVLNALPANAGIAGKATQQAIEFFDQYGVQLNKTEELTQRQIKYLGMYTGEGVASKGNIIGNRNMVWVNFEEGNVKASQLIGADGDIAILTPATQNEITDYYRWKKKVISERITNE